MRKQELLEKIWKLEKTDRLGIIVEESMTDSKGDRYGKYENLFENELIKAKEFLESIKSERDDNKPATFGARVRCFDDRRKYIGEPLIEKAAIAFGEIREVNFRLTFFCRPIKWC